MEPLSDWSVSKPCSPVCPFSLKALLLECCFKSPNVKRTLLQCGGSNLAEPAEWPRPGSANQNFGSIWSVLYWKNSRTQSSLNLLQSGPPKMYYIFWGSTLDLTSSAEKKPFKAIFRKNLTRLKITSEVKNNPLQGYFKHCFKGYFRAPF